MKDFWPLLQQDIAGVISADAVLGARPVVALDPGAMDSAIAEDVARVLGMGKDDRNGVGILVFPIRRVQDQDISNPFGPLTLGIRVHIVANTEINNGPVGTQIPLYMHARRVVMLLKLYTPVGFTQNLVAADPVMNEFTDNDLGVEVAEIMFNAREADFTNQIRLNRPIIAVAGNAYPYTVTVTGQALTDTIYFTTDNSHPYAGNATAQPYTGPVQIAAPCLFRARAFPAAGQVNQFASDTAAYNFA